MTLEEAIKILDVNVICSPKAFKFRDAVDVATVALKKQIPMKPIERIATSPVKIGNGIFGSGVKVHNCPNCNGLISPVHKCCYHCGQKLDWNTNDNTCICCGEIIPEGRQVCPKCEKG